MNVGFIGLGRMGSLMARNVADSGHDLALWNRTMSRAADLASETGGDLAPSPAELARRSEVVITMLADDDAVETVYGGSDGLVAGLGAGKVSVDMSTVAVATARRIAAEVDASGAAHVDAPVSGSIAAAEGRTLMIMAAGQPDAVATAMPVLTTMGSPVLEVGASGAGATLKLAVNSIVYTINQAVTEALLLAENSGVDRQLAYEAFMNSAVGAPLVKYRQKVFVEPGTTPVSFTMDLALKDMALILAQAEATGTAMPAEEASRRVMQAASDAGMGEEDMGMTAVYMRGLG